ncbi:MAG: restriction endonuclease subunit S, partial [Gemmatimonadota bacterium]|nr:restriction endonuclease subunit S [Gemmatimonadota bacterium]
MSEAKTAGLPIALRQLMPYAAYRHSGVEWLGEIPAHWKVKRLKHLAALNPESLMEDTDPTLEMTYVDIGSVDSLGRIVNREQLTFANAPSRARRRVRDGDVIVSTVRTYLRAIAPMRDPVPGTVVSTGFAVVRPTDDLTAAYAAYVLRAPYFVERVVANSKGVSFPAINESEMATYELATPPEPEQRAIAAFLDRETARIDTLVAKKERLIALLLEQRTALITCAVTKGLKPNIPMKESGVDWLGDIPAHWEVKQLRQAVVTLMDFRGRTPTKLGMDWGGDIPAISAVNVREGYLDLSRGVNYGSQELHDRWMGQGPTRKGDVLFTTEAPLGNVALVPDDNRYILSQRVVLLRPHAAQMMPEYLYRLLISSAFRQGVELMATGSTAEGVKRRYLMAMAVCVPQLGEQCAIAVFLDGETTRIDALIAKVRDAIDRLIELRT